MSRMSQQKKRKRKETAAINIRIPSELKRQLEEFADRDRRKLSQYLLILLENHVAQRNEAIHGPMHHPIQTGGSQPPARIQQQANARGKVPPLPVDKLVEIAESDEGWEGSDPRKLLAGTKVTI
jgi:hypothetical protein